MRFFFFKWKEVKTSARTLQCRLHCFSTAGPCQMLALPCVSDPKALSLPPWLQPFLLSVLHGLCPLLAMVKVNKETLRRHVLTELVILLNELEQSEQPTTPQWL